MSGCRVEIPNPGRSPPTSRLPPAPNPTAPPMADKLEITNPRRILLVGGPDSGKLTFLKCILSLSHAIKRKTNQKNPPPLALTGTLPANSGTVASPAGLSHSLHLKTAYYTVDVPIWIDELDPADAAEWAAGYLNQEAREVLHALGGFIITFRRPRDSAGLVTFLLRGKGGGGLKKN